MKIIIDRIGKDKWHFRIVGANGKTLAQSGYYANRRNAREGAELVANGTFGIVEAV